MILNLNFKLELFNEIRAKNEEDLLEADEQGLTLIPRQQALDLISDSAKVTDSTWDQIILDLALTRERERVATSQEILKNKMYSEKFNIQKKEMEDLLLRGAMKKLENKQVANKETDSSKIPQRELQITKYKSALKGVSDQVPMINIKGEDEKDT